MTVIEVFGILKKYIDTHGGGGGGTLNYNALENKPQIAGVTLSGDKSLSDLGIAPTAIGATQGNLAAFDSSGNPVDSGYAVGEITDTQWTAITALLG